MVGTLISTSGKTLESISFERRSLMRTSPPAFPPSEPVPICVQRKVPSQNLRSNTGNSVRTAFEPLIGCLRHHDMNKACCRRVFTQFWAQSPPPPFVAGFGYPANCDRVGG